MSNGLRWSKFFWQDWQKDKPLQGCSLAARGLWMEILCLAHDAEPYGHLLLNGKSPTVKQLGSIFGNTSEREVTKLLAELEAAGIFSRMDDGTIYCRRMVRDKDATDTFRAYGKTGGNPMLNGKDHAPKKPVGGLTPPLTPPLNPPLMPPHNPGLNGGVKLESETDSDSEGKKESVVYINTNLSSEIPGACARTDAPVATVKMPRETVATLIAVETITEKVGRKMRNVEFVGAFPRHSREVQIEAYARWTAPKPKALPLNPELLRSMPHRQHAAAGIGR